MKTKKKKKVFTQIESGFALKTFCPSYKGGGMPQFCYYSMLFILYWRPVFPISAKKCEIFSGVFSPAKNRRVCFPPKTLDSRGSRHLALVCRRNRGEKLQNLDEGLFFFFWEQSKIGEKNASIGVMTFFFFFFRRSHSNRTKMMRKFSAFSHWV